MEVKTDKWSTKTLLRKYAIQPKKYLGQSFLCDDRVAERIVDLLELKGAEVVVEVGPGLGVLTSKLAKRVGWVVAVEIDPRLVDVLGQELSAYDNVYLIEGDILKVDLSRIRMDFNVDSLKLIGNLPYQITSPLFRWLVGQRWVVEQAVFMVQKEVARRIVAPPGGKDYGVLSVFVQYYTLPTLLFDVPAQALYPRPKVDSSVVRLEILKEPPISLRDEQLFFRVVRAAFCHRRKMLRNALSSLPELSKVELDVVARFSGIDLGRRGETLSLAEFGRLADALWEKGSG